MPDYTGFADLTARDIYCRNLVTESNVGFDGNVLIGGLTENYSTDIELNLRPSTYNSDAWKMLDGWLRTNLIDTPPAPTKDGNPIIDKTKIVLNWINPVQVEAGFLDIKLPHIDDIQFQIKLTSDSSWGSPISTGSVQTTRLELYVEGNPSSSGMSGSSTYKYYTIDTGVQYDIRIFAVNKNDVFDKNYLEEFNGLLTETVGVPGPPRNFISTSITSSSASLTWDSPEDHDVSTVALETTPLIERYEIEYTPQSTERYGGLYSSSISVTNPTSTSTTLSNMLPGTTYNLNIKAKNTQNAEYGANIYMNGNLETSLPGSGNYISSNSMNSFTISTQTAKQLDGTVVNNVFLNPSTILTTTASAIRLNNTASTTDNNITQFTTVFKTNNTITDTISANLHGFSGSVSNGTYTGTNSEIELIISGDTDKYSASSSGFWRKCNLYTKALIVTSSSNKYSIVTQQTLLDGSTYTSGEVYYYIDRMSSSPAITNLGITNSTNLSYISGVPSYNSNSTFDIQLNVTNLCDWFLRSDGLHVKLRMYSSSGGYSIGNEETIQQGSYTYYEGTGDNSESTTLHNTNGNTLTNHAGQIQFKSTVGMTTINNVMLEDIKIRGIPYNIYTNGSTQYGNYIVDIATPKIRADIASITAISAISTQVVSGTGEFPTSFGSAYSHTDTLIGTNELQLLNGKFRTPKNVSGYKDYGDFFFPGSVTGPDYSTITDQTSDYRYVTFKFSNFLSGTTDKIRVTLHNTEGINLDLVNVSNTNHKMYMKVDGTTSFNTGWLDITSTVGGIKLFGDGKPVLESLSSTTTQRDCYIISGTSATENPIIYVRFGQQSNINSALYNITIQQRETF